MIVVRLLLAAAYAYLAGCGLFAVGDIVRQTGLAHPGALAVGSLLTAACAYVVWREGPWQPRR